MKSKKDDQIPAWKHFAVNPARVHARTTDLWAWVDRLDGKRGSI